MGFEEYHFDEQNDWNKNIIVNSSIDLLFQSTPIGSTSNFFTCVATLGLELDCNSSIE